MSSSLGKLYIYIGAGKYSLGRVVRLSMDGRIDYAFDQGVPAIGPGSKPENRVAVPLFAPTAVFDFSLAFDCAEEGFTTFDSCLSYLVRRLDDDVIASVQGGRDFCVQVSPSKKLVFKGAVVNYEFTFDPGRPMFATAKAGVKLAFFQAPAVTDGTC